MSASTDQAWPYDAVQDDPLTALRIPVVRTPYPEWKYEVCLMVSEPDAFGPEGLWGFALRPDEAEVRQIAAYIGYRMEYYNAGWRAKMAQRPLDIDATTNTVVLRKRDDGGWCYRRCSWQYGPQFVPEPGGDPESLERVLDRIHLYGDNTPSPKWLAWKAAHPEAFPKEVAT